MSIYNKETETGWKPPRPRDKDSFTGGTAGWTYYENGKVKEPAPLIHLRRLRDEIGDLASPVISRTWNFLNESASLIGDIEEQRGEMAVESGKALLETAGKTKELASKVIRNPFEVYDSRHWEEYGSPGTTKEYHLKKQQEIYDEFLGPLTIKNQPGGGELGDE